MSMYEADVSFFKDFLDDEKDLKASIWENSDFTDYIGRVGMKETLYEVEVFAESVAEGLRSQGYLGEESREDDPPFVTKARKLHSMIKSRRLQLRRAVGELYGQEELGDIYRRVEEEVGDR